MPTIADVAKLAKVSAGTVSRVMNGAENVSPDTRLRVEQAISELGYQPNFLARSLRTNRTNVIALLISEVTNYFWAALLRGVEEAVLPSGYSLFIANTDGNPAKRRQYMEQIINQRMDGAIIAPGQLSDSDLDTLLKYPIQLVCVDDPHLDTPKTDTVYSDSISGAFRLTQHLIQLGHRRIVLINGPQDSATANDRAVGYCLALAEADIPIDPSLICWGRYDREVPRRWTHWLLDQQLDFTAIFATNNQITIGTMFALEERGLRVPEDIAVVGFEDFYPDSRFANFMTVAVQSPYDMGLNATGVLLSRLDNDTYPHLQNIVLPTRFIIRQSCGSGQAVTPSLENQIDRVEGELVSRVNNKKIATLASKLPHSLQLHLPPANIRLPAVDKSRVHQLKQTLRRQPNKGTTIPHFEYAITNHALYHYVLEREPHYEVVNHQKCIAPEDQVEFAHRMGIAAVPCRFPWNPKEILSGEISSDLQNIALFQFPPLTDYIHFFERYVRAARKANVGIAADFGPIFINVDTGKETIFDPETAMIPQVATSTEQYILYQTKLVQLICDRFADELAFVLLSIELDEQTSFDVTSDSPESVLVERLQPLLYPALEHGLPTVVYPPGNLELVLPILHFLKVDAVYPAQPQLNDLISLKKAWSGKLCFMGGVPLSLLLGRDIQTLQLQITELRSSLVADGNYVLGVSGEIGNDVPYENFLTTLRVD